MIGAFALALGLAAAGYAAGWLTRDGTLAAAVVGGAVFAGGGLAGGLLLALFFVSGSVLTWLNRRGGVESSGSPKRGRNARQVLANGLWAAAAALLAPWRPETGWSLFAGALATAQSDTWATEIGAHARRPPRLLTSWNPVPRGTSGAVSLLGTAGGALGGVALAALALATGVPRRAAAAGLAGGLIGMAVDSLLGATVQARFFCDRCGVATERSPHHCGARARLSGGWPWLDNDGVNLLATAAGASVAALFSWLL